MKYEETCACGAKVQMEAMDAPELARAKAQWKIDHGPHGDNTMIVEQKRLVLEYQEMQAKVKKIEDQAYPAMVVGYDMIIANKNKGVVLYRATIHPGNGFHWEDPNSPITLNLQPKTMKLPDLETKELEALEAEASKSLAAEGQSALHSMVGEPPPAESVLEGMTKITTQLSQQAALDAEKLIFQKTLTVTPKQIRESVLGKTEVSDEQGQQDESKRDSGTAKTKKIATRSRIRSDDVGRRRNPRQG